jgi:hypothetical protein
MECSQKPPRNLSNLGSKHNPAAKFARVHRSLNVAIPKKGRIEKNRIRIANYSIPVSGIHAGQFINKLKGMY